MTSPFLLARDDVPETVDDGGVAWRRPLSGAPQDNVRRETLACPSCGGTMKLLALLTDPKSITRYLRAIGQPTDAPERSPARGPPYWKSTVLRRREDHDQAAQ